MDFVWEIENLSRQVWLVVLREWISSVSVVNFKLSRDVSVFVILRVSILKIRSKSKESQKYVNCQLSVSFLSARVRNFQPNRVASNWRTKVSRYRA